MNATKEKTYVMYVNGNHNNQTLQGPESLIKARAAKIHLQTDKFVEVWEIEPAGPEHPDTFVESRLVCSLKARK